jgi:two-component system sensor histidine kinase DegS
MGSNDNRQDLMLYENLKNELLKELEKHKQEFADVELKLNQCDQEVSKLTQKNASVTGPLQRIQNQLDQYEKSDIVAAYDNVLESQQRLFLMRGQLEKIQIDYSRLKTYRELIEHVLNELQSIFPEDVATSGVSKTYEMIETIIQAQEAERQRLSRQMHDGPAQALSNFILQTEIAMRLFDIDQAKAKEELGILKNSATTTFQKVRDFIFDLRPMMLDDLGLVPTLKQYVDVYKNQPGVSIILTLTGRERRLESYIEVLIFRSIQELLGNSLRHSQASQIKIQLDMGETNIKVTIEDDGKGFNVEIIDDRANKGIKVIRERVEMLGGEFDIDSVIGQRTRISFQIPAIEMVRLT